MRFAPLLIAMTLTLIPLGSATPPPVLTSCALPGGTAARCGTFSVAEDRRRPEGRMVSLRIAVLPGRGPTNAPDPIVHIAGGPGGSAIEDAGFMLSVFGEANRDIVLVDQRGTGASSALTCAAPRTQPRTLAAIRAYARTCIESVDADVAQYTSAPAMDDLAHVIRALGYERVNLYGGSYGATAIQYFLAQHPDLVRTAILDGATLLDVPIFERWGRNGERALRSILARCATSGRCASAYPRGRREAFEVFAALRRKPARADGRVIDVASAAGAFQQLSRSEATAAQIPWIAHEARRGFWPPLAKAVADYERQRTAPGVMYWAIVCNEPWARQDPQRTAAASRGTYLAERTAFDARVVATVCSVVPRTPQPSWSYARPASDKPILFVVGGADPQDPVTNVAAASRTMPNSRTVVVPGAGHGAVHLGCVPAIAMRFLESGSTDRLDPKCASAYKPPAFRIVR